MLTTSTVIPPRCWPSGSPWASDPELDRLRELERQAQIEQEKAAIRERLRRLGYPDGVGLPSGPRPYPYPGVTPVIPVVPGPWPWPGSPVGDRSITVTDVIRRIPR